MRLAEKPVPRSYHLQDYDWTPLSQNPCWKASIFTSPDVTRITIGFGRASYSIAISNVGRDKSFVDDLYMERGIVSMRVGFVLRSAEIKPLFFDLFTDQKNHFDCHSTFVMNLIAQFGAPPLEYLYSYLLKESWVVVFAYFLVLFQNARGKETQWVHEVYMHSTAQSHLALCF